MGGTLKLSNYVSNLKWLLIGFRSLRRSVLNWQEVMIYYLSPVHSRSLSITFRNDEVLIVPPYYLLEAIVETLLQNAYEFDEELAGEVVVDIGASIGDFVLLASRQKGRHVYAYEVDKRSFAYLQRNVAVNRRQSVFLFNEAANRHTLSSILSKGEKSIDFLKIDCEGCEYEVILESCREALMLSKTVSLELHHSRGHRKSEIASFLKELGFRVNQKRRFGRGHYLSAAIKNYPVSS